MIDIAFSKVESIGLMLKLMQFGPVAPETVNMSNVDCDLMTPKIMAHGQ
jgi:hypothetical protein